jgi:hypothetical protein
MVDGEPNIRKPFFAQTVEATMIVNKLLAQVAAR